MNNLLEQAVNDMTHAKQHLRYSIYKYRLAKSQLGIANRLKVKRTVKSRIMIRLNKARAQLKRDIRAAQNALDWYQSVKLGMQAEYRRTLGRME